MLKKSTSARKRDDLWAPSRGARRFLVGMASLCGLWLGLLASSVTAQVAVPSGIDPAHDWPWWRGPLRNGVGSAASDLPVRFGSRENVQWKTPVPGRGHSSPIIVKDRVYLSTADESRQIHSVLCYRLQDGQPQWKRDLNRGGFPGNNHPKNTEASPTVASDGERLYVTFFHHQKVTLTALDLDGEVVWTVDVGPFNPKKYEYGYAPSPLVLENSVIVAAEFDGPSQIAAFEAVSGRRLWQVQRPNNITFSSPVLAQVAGRQQLLISGSQQVASYDPQTGRLLWNTPGTTFATCGTMVWNDQLVFASGGYPKPETIAVNASTGQAVWKNSQKCYEQSMILIDDYLYGLTDKGVIYCWEAGTGAEQWRHRLAGPVSASPVYAGGHVYWANEKGTFYVFRPNSAKFDLVAENRLGDESFASPAISGNRMIVRIAEGSQAQRQEYLICLGK